MRMREVGTMERYLKRMEDLLKRSMEEVSVLVTQERALQTQRKRKRKRQVSLLSTAMKGHPGRSHPRRGV